MRAVSVDQQIAVGGDLIGRGAAEPLTRAIAQAENLLWLDPQFGLGIDLVDVLAARSARACVMVAQRGAGDTDARCEGDR